MLLKKIIMIMIKLLIINYTDVFEYLFKLYKFNNFINYIFE